MHKHSQHITINGKEIKQAYLRLRRSIAVLKHEHGIPRNLIDRMEHTYVNLEDMQPQEQSSPAAHHHAQPVSVSPEKLSSCYENIHVVRSELNHLKNNGHLRMADQEVVQALNDITMVFDILHKIAQHIAEGHSSHKHH